MVSAESVTIRGRLLFGGPNVGVAPPFRSCRTMWIFPASRSTFVHASPHSSAFRAPLSSARA
jgi:hypothetical protein